MAGLSLRSGISVGLHPEKCASYCFQQPDSPKPRLVQQEHFSSPAKAEICYPAWNQNLTQQDALRRPDVHTMATAAVNRAAQVALDTVGYAVVAESKEPSIGENGLTRIPQYVKGISIVVVNPYQPRERVHRGLTNVVDGLGSSILPLPRIQSVSVTYTIFSSGEKQIPLGRPKPSAMATLQSTDG